MERTAADGKSYKTKYYSLDGILSVGYRVNSSKATQFRIWATETLKAHLIKGYTIHKPRIAQQGISELHQTIELLSKTLKHHEIISEIGSEAIGLILSYAKTWHLLLAYDEDNLTLPEYRKDKFCILNYSSAIEAIASLKSNLIGKKEATVLFGQERKHAFEIF